MRAKYIRFKNDYLLVFSAAEEHARVADIYLRSNPGSEVLSAGFVSFHPTHGDQLYDVEAVGYGESYSLKVESLPDDSFLLTQLTRND